MRQAALLFLGFFLACPPAALAQEFTLESAAFPDHGAIPARYTCDGAGQPPPLAWRDAPAGTRAYALVVTDPDAPDPTHPTHTFVHWVVFNLPATARSLPADAGTAMPAGTGEGTNGAGRTGYTPPCPPIGRHRYFFHLFALNARLAITGHPDRASLTEALHGHVIGDAVLVGTYAHSR